MPFLKVYPVRSIGPALAEVLKSPDYQRLADLRNVLSHRGTLPRNFHICPWELVRVRGMVPSYLRIRRVSVLTGCSISASMQRLLMLRRRRPRRRVTALWMGGWLMACACGELPPRHPTNRGVSAALEQSTGESCALDRITPEVIKVEKADASEWHGRFDLTDLPRLWEPAEPDEAISRFRETVRGRLLGRDLDARSLIERQRAIFAVAAPEWRGEAANATLLLEGRVGTITPVSCLEAMLWKWQAARYPMLEHPTEFGAFVLRGHGRVRVYLSSADLVGQRIRDEITKRVQADASAGFRLVTHIHNHPFLFNRKVGDRMWTLEATKEDVAGALAPSMTDVQFYRNLRNSLGLQEAWVMNGLNTSRFPAGEFDVLTAR